MQEPGANFIHERNPNLHASDEVEGVVNYLRAGGESIPNEPADKISAYLGFLANRDYVNDGILTGDQSSINRQIAAHVIKDEDVPQGYFELQRRIARERGHGDVKITREMRNAMVESVQADQKAGLSKWVEYLGGQDGAYPDWFKYYTWTSVTKLGGFDKEKGEFLKRSKGTTAAYPELNREALAYVYDVLNKSRVPGEAADGGVRDGQLQKLLKDANFGRLYAHAVLEAVPKSPELLKDVRGSWKKFSQTDDPRTARRLSGSLQGHGTGWCTAGESTASNQLSSGDFYVYYTRDEDGKDTIPRVAIRMERRVVAEVRGINPSQELEPELADVASEQLKDLPGSEAYARKAEDMKRLTAIDKKITVDPTADLTDTELRFLYELDHDIQGFGYEPDPRVQEIRTKRGGRDKPELARLLPEATKDQFRGSFAAYRTVTDYLAAEGFPLKGESGMSTAEFEQMFAAKDQEWRANGTYDYLLEQLIENGSRFSLVATPDVEAEEKQIVGLAEEFGKDWPYATFVYDEMYRKNSYTAREWSGRPSGQRVRFSLIPSRFTAELSYERVDQKMRILSDMQTAEPNLNFHVPSLLEAVTYWHTLHAQGDKLSDGLTYDKTRVLHFDLPPKVIDGLRRIPDSYIHSAGGPVLGIDAGVSGGTRLAVG